MRRGFGAAGVAGQISGCVFASVVICASPAGADVVIAVDKAAQRMAVTVDGKQEYVWKVSTGTGGAPKAGTYRPQRLEKSWFSHKYDMSPMPHSIFFDESKGIAIHGTQYVSRLGTSASHGCVRLAPANAATLFKLVQSRGKADTTIIVTHSGWPDLAKLAPKPERTPESKPEAAPALNLQAAPEPKPEAKPVAVPDAKPAAAAPIKASLPVVAAPKQSAATPVVATAKKPDRVLMERMVDAPPGTMGALATRPAEPPSLASAGSEPVKLPPQQQ
ncbi:L,D-transpeptidase [Rhodoplanes sp. Z2-YC6860]|uniref:L,D-transpeptidase n=1 Tax=Rhodoplanes sp. Z2-YC6860 TaxID=674703 RepID=UPI00078D3EC2|nr:L,D-transpeptidase [Rhodoplanes sp. Z2-YC6860]AMN45180.1 ErfK/YbiS/YcfS/YnhG family protein [Rhodoplanes sp. Z2-YC6860]